MIENNVQKKIYIDEKFKTALIFDGRIRDIIYYDEENILKNIYLGRVTRIIKSMNAAFIDVGLKDNVYLNLDDEKENIKENQTLIIQIKKTGEDKGPRGTREISIPGKSLVYFPKNNFVKYSKKLSKEKKEELKKISLEGIVYRTEAQNFSKEEIKAEYENLKEKAEKILGEEKFLPVPRLLYREDILDRFIHEHPYDIVTNSKNIEKAYKNLRKVEFEKNYSIKYNPQINKDYLKLFERIVHINDGSNIYIDYTEAMTVIDVNSSQSTDFKNFEDLAYKINLKAIEEIALQIKLRNISGIIMIDLINMKDEKNRQDILKKMEEEFIKNDISLNIHGYTSLGICELSRRNQGLLLKNKL